MPSFGGSTLESSDESLTMRGHVIEFGHCFRQHTLDFRHILAEDLRRSGPFPSDIPTPKKLVRFVHIIGRVDYASTGGNIMHDTHRKAAERHELAARAHRTAAEHNEKGDNEAGSWHAERAL